MRGRLYQAHLAAVDIQMAAWLAASTIAGMTTTEEIAARLRSIRIERKLTLLQIEKLTSGAIRAVSLGSYERGDRALSINRAIEIASFYDLPLEYLLVAKSHNAPQQGRFVFDLHFLKLMIAGNLTNESLPLAIIASFLRNLIKARGDFNGAVLSLRAADSSYLALVLGIDAGQLEKLLNDNKLLVRLK